MSTAWALLVSLGLLIASAFFVAAEFALVASRRHRLEELAAAGSRAARAAVRGSRELSLMLAGAQLGITLCALGLGALAKPALADLLGPLLTGIGLPAGLSTVIAVVLAVAVVVFLHMVVGEMAPKSWAISHPERSALLLALPFRAFARVARPALSVLNGMANATLRAVKVTPQDTLAQAHGPDDLRILLRQSREHGLLPEQQHRILAGVLQLRHTTVAQVMQSRNAAVTIPADADATEVERVSRESGRSRLIVLDEHDHPVGIVHVRDAVRATTAARTATARDLMSAPLALPAATTVAEAATTMRQHRAQLALITDDSAVVGLVALEDLIEEILGEFDDETDRPAA
ncbi:MAG TPA: hemolysin family protein [Actinophytocola sp.]|uniref:hemolysin family protein n=1 Tax=Actinophytocola sp. TaxID=1872138 RepID=UPI002DBA0B59|nr:hemolysin family protein [Actinophytocola sp.]HEU5474905.1 hemolysin family protein [Actinophytocola sp.]